jgi:phosphatidylserine decarboxylase precursor
LQVIGMLEALGHSMAPAELSALFTKLDASGDGKLDSAEILRWFRSAEFQTTPFAVSLLSFLSDGREGLQHVFNDITDVAKSSEKRTRSGAAVLVLDEGHKSLTVDQGLKVLDRETGLIMTEHIPQFVKMAIGLMYNGIGNRLTGSAAVRGLLKRLSEKEGAIMNSPDSRKKIAPFIRGYNINVSECKKDVSEYKNFNEFFYRELKPEARPIAALNNDSVAVSPADCRMVVYQTTSETTEVWVKGAKFTIEALLGPECADVAGLFVGGGFCLARLAPQDYHRFHVPVAGEFWRHHSIDGALFTVNPIAVRQAKPGIYTKNKRDVYLIKTREFGLVAMVAVGATVVGSINTVSTLGSFLERGNDHGFFAFGGSTILVLFQPGTVQFDEDLLSNSRRPLETFVRVGNQVAVATNPTGNHTLGLQDTNPAWAARRAATAARA